MELWLVEDDPVQARLFEAALSREGLHVRHCAELAEALELIGRTAAEDFADAVLLDVILGRGSGFEALDRLRSRPELDSVPVLMWSATVRREDLVRARREGASALVAKPSGLGGLRRMASAVHRHLRSGTDLAAMVPLDDR